MRFSLYFSVSFLCLFFNFISAHAQVSVPDAQGKMFHLEKPAQRIISLSPHLTEILFAAGAGEKTIAAVSYSNWPPQAKKLPVIGDGNNMNLELIAKFNPDLILAWQSGNRDSQLTQLHALGFPVYVSEPQKIEDIATLIRNVGILADTSLVADKEADVFINKINRLKQQYSQLPIVTTFYEAWNHPLITVNGQHMISDVIHLCGGKNIFDTMPQLSAAVNTESVLQANPEVIIASGMAEEKPEWLDDWRKWPQLVAVEKNNLFFLPPDIIQRQTPRIIQGAEKICEFLQQARTKRAQ